MIKTSPQTNQAPPPPRKSGWSPERRAKHAASIKIWAPWAKSTGPRTKAGKARSSRNACKPNAHAAMKKALRGQGRYLAEVKAYIRLKEFSVQNELLKNRRRALLRKGRKVTNQLAAALLYARLSPFPAPQSRIIMQKTCFFPPPAANS